MRGVAVDGRRASDGASVATRLALHSTPNSVTGCLEWTAARHDSMGYARLSVDGRMTYVHRAAWELVHGPVPEGMVLRHSCDNPPCINVAHLSLGTQAQNVADMHRKKRCDRHGERNNSARLTWPLVRTIRARHQAGESTAALASSFQMSWSQVKNVVTYTQWRNDPMNNVLTIDQAVELTGIQVLDHLDRQVEIPLLNGLQAQGDVLVVPAAMASKSSPAATPVPLTGVLVVRGENGGNSHTILIENGDVFCDVRTASVTDLTLATLTVCEGAVALLAHPEHAFNRIGPGSYVLRRQREQGDVQRLVAD